MAGVHDVRTRKMGDMVVVDAHLEVDAQITVEEGHDIAVEARQRVMQRHRVLNLMTHVDPGASQTTTPSSPGSAAGRTRGFTSQQPGLAASFCRPPSPSRNHARN